MNHPQKMGRMVADVAVFMASPSWRGCHPDGRPSALPRTQAGRSFAQQMAEFQCDQGKQSAPLLAPNICVVNLRVFRFGTDHRDRYRSDSLTRVRSLGRPR